MRKFIIKSTSLFLVAVMLSSQVAFAIPTKSLDIKADMDVNFSDFEDSFQELNELEAAVLSNEITSAQEAINQGFEIEQFAGFDSVHGDLEIDWPAALWGFLCCPIGFFIYVTNKDRTKDEKTSYWIGVAASTVLSGLTTIASGGRFSTF